LSLYFSIGKLVFPSFADALSRHLFAPRWLSILRRIEMNDDRSSPVTPLPFSRSTPPQIRDFCFSALLLSLGFFFFFYFFFHPYQTSRFGFFLHRRTYRGDFPGPPLPRAQFKPCFRTRTFPFAIFSLLSPPIVSSGEGSPSPSPYARILVRHIPLKPRS